MNVLWRNKVGADAAPEYKYLLHDDINLIVETDKEKSVKHFDWMTVLVDGSPDALALDSKNLAHVLVPYVGIKDELREMMLERPHLSLYNSHFNDAFVAQHAVALLLAVTNRVPEADKALREGNWKPAGEADFHSFFLEGKHCLLLGYGAIAKALEPRLLGLGLSLSAYKRTPDSSASIPTYSTGELHEALSKADVTIISLPSTPETKNLLDSQAFKAMKQGSLLINVGRGDVVDQFALYDVLEAGYLFGAGFDVWWNYPKGKEQQQNTLPSDAPLHTLSNFVMSPHRAASAQSWMVESFKEAATVLNSIAIGQPKNLLDAKKGY